MVQLNETMTADDVDDVKTVRLNASAITKTEPVVGWLVGLNGVSYGESYRLKSGKNYIGRGSNMDVIIKGDNSISRDKHAVVIYEPKAKIFIAQQGDSRELFYVNDELVLSHVVMKKNDIISLGNTKLMLIPCCDDAFTWEDVMENNR